MPLTCRCSSAAESGRRCQRAPSVCQGNGIYCDGCAHGSDLMPVNEFLKCLLKQIMIFKYQDFLLENGKNPTRKRKIKWTRKPCNKHNTKYKVAFDLKSKLKQFQIYMFNVDNLTISVWISGGNAIVQIWNVEECCPLISLHHHLQLAFWSLYKFLCVYQRQVLSHCAIDLHWEERTPFSNTLWMHTSGTL